MTTSAPIPNTYGSSTLDSVISQGAGAPSPSSRLALVHPCSGLTRSTPAGRINVGAALAAKTLISPAVLELNDTGFPSRTQRITLQNRNSDAVTYTFTSTIAQGMVTYDNVRLRFLRAAEPERSAH